MPPRPTHRPLTVVALVLAIFMSALEATVVGTAMPTIVSQLGGLALYGWVGSSYLLASTVTVPLFGRLADVYGRKPIVFVGVVLFLAGSLASGAATSIEGLGAGAMQPVTLTIVGDLFDVAERGKVQAAFGAVWATAAATGPLVGGLLVHALSWRWVFWINVPFGVVSMLVLALAYRESRREGRAPRIDWLGAALVATGSVALLLAAQGERTWLSLALGVGLLVAFGVWEARAPEPLLPLSLALRRDIGVASLSSGLLGAALMTSVLFVPLWAQGVRGASPTDAGATIAPMLIGWPIASALSSRVLARIGFRLPILVGSGVVLVSVTVLALLAETSVSLWAIRAAAFVFGLGMGLANTAILIGVQSAVGHEQRGVATASALFARSMGGALGVGVVGALFALRLAERLPPARVASMLAPDLDAAIDPVAADALAYGLAPVFVALVAVALVNALLVGLYPRTSSAPIAGPPALAPAESSLSGS